MYICKRLQIFIFGCRFLPFPKTNSQNLLIVLKHKEQLNLQQIHLKLKKKFQKTAEATDGLISNKIVGVVTRLCNDESITMTTSHSKSIISIQEKIQKKYQEKHIYHLKKIKKY